jgi:hypothetical protein
MERKKNVIEDAGQTAIGESIIFVIRWVMNLLYHVLPLGLQ